MNIRLSIEEAQLLLAKLGGSCLNCRDANRVLDLKTIIIAGIMRDEKAIRHREFKLRKARGFKQERL